MLWHFPVRILILVRVKTRTLKFAGVYDIHKLCDCSLSNTVHHDHHSMAHQLGTPRRASRAGSWAHGVPASTISRSPARNPSGAALSGGLKM